MTRVRSVSQSDGVSRAPRFTRDQVSRTMHDQAPRFAREQASGPTRERTSRPNREQAPRFARERGSRPNRKQVPRFNSEQAPRFAREQESKSTSERVSRSACEQRKARCSQVSRVAHARRAEQTSSQVPRFTQSDRPMRTSQMTQAPDERQQKLSSQAPRFEHAQRSVHTPRASRITYEQRSGDAARMQRTEHAHRTFRTTQSLRSVDSRQSDIEDHFVGKSTRVKTLLRWVCIVLLMAAVCLVVFLAVNAQIASRAGLDENAQYGQLENKTEDEWQAQIARKNANTKFDMSISSFVEMENADSWAPFRIENSQDSSCLLQVSIMRDDTAQTIYKSGIIEPGTFVEYAPLNLLLEPGTYKCTANLYALNTGTKQSEDRITTKLTIEVKGQ